VLPVPAFRMTAAHVAANWPSKSPSVSSAPLGDHLGKSAGSASPSGVGARSAQWSPDGRLIAFMSCCADPEVWVVHPSGSGLREVTIPSNGSQSWTPVWAPNGNRLLFQRVDRSGDVTLFSVAIDGTGLVPVTELRGLTSYTWGTAPTG
jgi:Tol biopolymer transport system component